MYQFIEYVANGIFLGAIYALLAVPMTVVWATTEVLDLGIGPYAVIAGVVAVALGLPWGAVAGIGAAIAAGAVTGGMFVSFHAMRPYKDSLPIVLGTFALLIAGTSALLTAVGTDAQFLDPIRGNLALGEMKLRYQGLFNLAVCVVVFVIMLLVLKRTPAGLSMRASAISDRAAGLVGIAVRRTQFLTFVLGAAVAGLAGVLAAMTVGLSYLSPFTLTLAALTGAILVGTKNPTAALAGGMALGVVESLGNAYLPNGWAMGLPSLLIVLVLASSRVPASAFSGARP